MSDISPDEKDLLIAMYGEMWNNINRHVMIVWQSATAILGSLALFSLVEKNIIGLDMGTTLIIILIVWSLAHTYDAATWFNRNQAIISGIERELLGEELRKRLHPVIGKNRSPKKLITQMGIQQALGLALWVLLLGHHFLNRVAPGIVAAHSHFEWARATPYLVTFAAIIPLLLVRKAATT